MTIPLETILGLCWNPGRMTLVYMRRCLFYFWDKRYPEWVTGIDFWNILDHRWKRENNVLSYTEASLSGLERVPRGFFLWSTLRTTCSNMPLVMFFCRHFSIWILNGGPLGALGGQIWDTFGFVLSEVGFQMYWGVNFGKGLQNGRGSPTASQSAEVEFNSRYARLPFWLRRIE